MRTDPNPRDFSSTNNDIQKVNSLSDRLVRDESRFNGGKNEDHVKQFLIQFTTGQDIRHIHFTRSRIVSDRQKNGFHDQIPQWVT